MFELKEQLNFKLKSFLGSFDNKQNVYIKACGRSKTFTRMIDGVGILPYSERLETL